MAMAGSEMRERAREWAGANPGAWGRMVAAARANVSAGRRFSIGRLAEEARWAMRVEGRDQGFKVNNTLRAPLARMIAEEVPGAEGLLEMRRSKADA